MPKDNYTSISGGLKLKGVKSGAIKKRKPKKPSTALVTTTTTTQDRRAPSPESAAVNPTETAERDDDDGGGGKEPTQAVDEDEVALAKPEAKRVKYMTPTERQFEEKKRRRLEEKLVKEGSKTHKERVEELNAYLSRLSEHHDMPRIGPG